MRLLEPRERGRRRGVFEFSDLVSVKRLVALLEEGVPLRRIRRTLETLREQRPEVERPLGALVVWDARSGRVAYRHRGVLAETDGQLLLELGTLEVACAVAPLGADPEDARARALEEAERWFERGCRLDADRSTWGEAIEAYQQALECDPEFADAHCNLGTVYYNQNRRAVARECFERAIEIEPRHVEAHLNLAALYEEQERLESALAHYKVALEADPLCADTHVSLALLYEKLGLARKARTHWRRYLQLDPGGAWADVARRHLGG